MELRDALVVLRRRWLTAVVVLLVALLAVLSVSALMPRKFTATTRLFFAVRATTTVTDLAQGSSFARTQMTSYAEVAVSPVVLKPVIDRLGLTTGPDELAESLATAVPDNTAILDVSATRPNAVEAADIANAVGAELSSVVGTLNPPQADGSSVVKVTTLTTAEAPVSVSSPRMALNLVIGGCLGLLLGIGVALVRDVLDTKLRTEADVRRIVSNPILGRISFTQDLPTHPVIVRDEPLSGVSEEVRRLRTNLQFVDVAERPKSIVVTSSISGEGKSTVALNLAVALADGESRVILVDADLRRPSIAEYAGLEGSAGLTSVLIGRAELEDVVQPVGSHGLDVLPSGPVPPNPSELLGSAAMGELLDQLTKAYDVVLLDSPPLLPVTDAAVLTRKAGGALVVVGVDRLHRAQLIDTFDLLETAGAHVFGVVVNKISKRDAGGYGYESNYLASQDAPEVKSKKARMRTVAPTPQPTAAWRLEQEGA